MKHVTAYCGRYAGELTPEIQTSLLNDTSSDDVLDCWIAYMSNRYYDRHSSFRHDPQIMRICEDWPAI